MSILETAASATPVTAQPMAEDENPICTGCGADGLSSVMLEITREGKEKETRRKQKGRGSGLGRQRRVLGRRRRWQEC